MSATLDLSPASVPIIVQQGSRALAPLEITDETTGLPVALTGYLARMKVRDTPTGSTVLLDLSTSGVGLVWVNDTGGLLNIDISAVTLAGVTPGIWAYDLELVPPDGSGGWVEAHAVAWFSGTFRVKPESTR